MAADAPGLATAPSPAPTAPLTPWRDALRVTGRALEDTWDHLFATAACSLLWLLLVLLVLPSAPATLALVEAARRMQRREEVGPRAYLRSVAARFGVGWRWGAVAAAVAVMLVVDALVVGDLLPPLLAPGARWFFVAALVVWVGINGYALPLLFAQERMSVRLALRNAAVMVLRHPGFSLLLLLIAAALTALSLALVAVSLLATPLFLAFLAARAVDDRLAR